MTYVEFFLLAEENLFSLIFLSFAIVFVYLIIYRNYILSIFDPMFFAIVATGLANAIFFFLFYLNEIRSEYFYSYIFTELAFFTGFFLFKPIKPHKYYLGKTIPNKLLIDFDEKFITILFYWAIFFHVFSQLLTYALVGLPILMESRLTTYSGGSGFGIFGRILDVSSSIGVFLLFYRFFYCENSKPSKYLNYLYLVFTIFAMIVSGNKTNLLFLIYYIFILNIFMLKIKGKSISLQIKKTMSLQKVFLISSIILIFLVIIIQLSRNPSGAQLNDSWIVLIKRIVSFGDVYYLTLPNDIILQLHDKHGPFLQLFKDPLGVLRIVPWSELPIDSGFAVTNYHYGDIASGPNPRYNYFAILYFNLGGQIVYCFFVGVVISFIRNKLFYILPKHIFYGLLYSIISINIIYAFQDMPTLIIHIFSILLIFPIIFLLSIFTIDILNKSKISS